MNYKEQLDKYKEFLIARQMSLTYHPYVERFLRFLELKNYDINNITQEIWTEFLKEHIEYKTETINLYIKALTHFLKDFMGKESNYLGKQVKLGRPERKVHTVITEKELNNAINYIVSTNTVYTMTPIKVKAVAYLLFYTGLRIGEVLSLRRSDFNLESSRLVVPLPNKGKSERVVVCIKQLMEVITKYFESEKEERNAFNISEFQLRNFVRKINKFIPNKVLTPHTLRHSFGRHLYQKGVDINTIKDQLGHKNIQTTILYTDSDIDTQDKIIRDKLE